MYRATGTVLLNPSPHDLSAGLLLESVDVHNPGLAVLWLGPNGKRPIVPDPRPLTSDGDTYRDAAGSEVKALSEADADIAAPLWREAYDLFGDIPPWFKNPPPLALVE